MVKSHRSTLTLFHQWPQSPSDRDIPTTPVSLTTGSPSEFDPFGNTTTLPETISVHPRPPSTFSPQSSCSDNGATPKIVLASPSVSTIHYLFPSSDTRIHLGHTSQSGAKSSTSWERDKSVRQRTVSSRRDSYTRIDRPFSVNRKKECASSAASLRSLGSTGNGRSVLGQSKRVISGSRSSEPLDRSSTEIKEVRPGSVRTLRRQPSMADLGRGKRLHVEIEMSSKGVLGEIVNSKQDGLISPKSVVPPSVYVRRRSLSLTSPRSTSSMEHPSPTLPHPDLGDPLSFVEIMPSPSFSHLDYYTAGSTGPSRRTSVSTTSFSKKTSAIYPTSAAMSRGNTRKGLGSYDSGKITAREDAEKRLNGERGGSVVVRSRMNTLRRSISSKKKDEVKNHRPRSQSLSTRSVRNMQISPPMPSLDDPAIQAARAIPLPRPAGDARWTATSSTPGSPYSPLSLQSEDTSLYPETTPSSGFVSLPPDDRGHRSIGRQRHRALMSEISLLESSSLGLGYSPISEPSSLPQSLAAEAIDLTERGRKLCRDDWDKLDSMPVKQPEHKPPADEERSTLLAQNTFYLPPPHVQAAQLRTSRSMGPNQLRRAITSANLAADARAKVPSISFRRSRPDLQINMEKKTVPPVPTPMTSVPMTPQTYTNPGTNTSTNSRMRRTITAFSLCSPPNAIEPLPSVELPEIEPPRIRNKRSTSYLTASSSLRVVFGKDGFVARSLSSAFDRDTNAKKEQVPESSLKGKISAPLSVQSSQQHCLHSKQVREEQEWRKHVLSEAISQSISSGMNRLAAGETDRKMVSSSSSKPRLGIPAQLLNAAPVGPGGQAQDHMVNDEGETEPEPEPERKRTNVKSPQRETRRSFAPSEDGLETLAGLGETMLRHGPVCSFESGLNLRAGTDEFFTLPADAPAMPHSAHPTRGKVAPASPSAGGLTSRWSPSPVKRGKKSPADIVKPVISLPLPLAISEDAARIGLGAVVPHRKAPNPITMPVTQEVRSPRSNTLRSLASRSQLFGLGKKEKENKVYYTIHGDLASPPKASLTSPSTLSLSVLRSPISPSSRSKSSLNFLHPNLKPISSESITISTSLLDELTARDEEMKEKEREGGTTASSGREDKVKKVLSWREGVGENEEIRQLEEKWKSHMESEKEWIRGIADREAARSETTSVGRAQLDAVETGTEEARLR